MSTPLKWMGGSLLFVIATIGGIWLAGFLFFLLSKVNPLGQTNLGTWWTYWTFYHTEAVIAKRLNTSAMLAALISYGGPFFVITAILRDVRSLHGEARFATLSEIKTAGLLGTTGIILGKIKNRFLLFPGMQFVLLAAPTRSGKGVGIVIPNLLHWPESLVVIDIKLENFLITSKFRAQGGQEVYLFNPFSISDHMQNNPLCGRTHRYNPLGYISDDPRLRVTDILALGYALYPGEGRDPFFDDAARNLFLGLALYVCETPSLPRTIGELLRQSSGKGVPIKEYIQKIIAERNALPDDTNQPEGHAPLSQECVEALNRFTATSDNTLSSIMATFNVPLTLWASPIIDAVTSANDFDLRDVRQKRMSIYIGIPANKLAEAKLLINIFYTQLINLNTNCLLHGTREIKYTCLMLNDEFTAPGRINIIDKANSYMAGYGLRMLNIIQSPGQLEAKPPQGYGPENARTLITNHACQIFFTPREQRDANAYSEALGYYTFKAKGQSRQLGGSADGRRSESESDQKRALMMPQELKEMSQREQIISLENTKPIKCQKIHYYDDPIFLDRLKSVMPSLAKLGKKKPTQLQFERIWQAGEGAVNVPLLDVDFHQAKVQGRYRRLTLEDISKGIDLTTLKGDFSKVPLPKGETLTSEDIEAFVGQFMASLDEMDAIEQDKAVSPPQPEAQPS